MEPPEAALAGADSACCGGAGHPSDPHRQDPLAQHSPAAGTRWSALGWRLPPHLRLRRHGLHHPVRPRVHPSRSHPIRGRGACPRLLPRAEPRRHINRRGWPRRQRLCGGARHYAGLRADGYPPRAWCQPRRLPRDSEGNRLLHSSPCSHLALLHCGAGF